MGYLYDRNDLNGNSEIKETEIPLDGGSMHVSQFDRQTNERYSWDTDGSDANSKDNAHYTNQNYSKGDSNRH